MTRVLLVDNDPNIHKRLTPRLEMEIPGIVVDSAETLRDATAQAMAALAEEEPYDFAVLDIMLPVYKRDGPENLHKPERRKLIEALGGKAVVFNITVFLRHPDVSEFLVEENLQNTEQPRTVVIDKTEVGWEDNLIKQIRLNVHSSRIERQFDRIFGARRGNERRSSSRPPSLAETRLRSDLLVAEDLTQDLNVLIRDIELHWADLKMELKKKIETVFQVVEFEPGKFGLKS